MTYNNFSSLLSKTHEGHIFHRDHQKLYISQGFIRDSLKPISYRSDNSFKGSNKWRKSPVTTTPWSIGICLRDILSFIVWLITILSFFNYRLTAYNLQIYISSPFNLQRHHHSDKPRNKERHHETFQRSAIKINIPQILRCHRSSLFTLYR